MKERKKQLLGFLGITALISVAVYAHISVYSLEPFFYVRLSDRKAPINKIAYPGSALRDHIPLAPVAVDALGRIYIAGLKDGEARILVLNSNAQVERIISPRFKDGRALRWCSLFSVSPSGNIIWTVEWDKAIYPKEVVHRVTVHDREGKGKMDWLITGYGTSELLLNACSENAAYILASDSICFYFETNAKKIQKFQIPEIFRLFYPVFFHEGKYWGVAKIDKSVSKVRELRFKEQITMSEVKGHKFGVATWSPQEGIRLVSTRLPVKVSIQWIDEQGNFYGFHRGQYTFRLPHWLNQVPILNKMIQNIATISIFISLRLFIFASEGRLLDVIPLLTIIQTNENDKLICGQLVKVDKTGIYLEVAKVNRLRQYELKEYQIVKIVKKPRWKIWWTKIIKRY